MSAGPRDQVEVLSCRLRPVANSSRLQASAAIGCRLPLLAAAAEAFLSLEEAWRFGQLCHQLATGAFDGHLAGVQLTHSWREPGRMLELPRHPWVWIVPGPILVATPSAMPRWRRLPPCLMHRAWRSSAWIDIMIETREEWDIDELAMLCRRDSSW